MFFFALVAMPVKAEDIPKQAQSILQESGVDAGNFGGWELSTVLKSLEELFLGNIKAPLHFAVQAIAYLLLSCTVALVCTESGWRKCIEAVSVLGFGVMSLSAMMQLLQFVSDQAQESQAYLAMFVPVYTGILTLGGQAAGAAAYSGMFFSVAALLSTAMEKLLLPILQIYFCFSVSAALWQNQGIAKAAELFGKCLSWLLKGCGILFSFVLGLQSVLAGNADSTAVKLGKSVLSGAIPLVGDAAAAALSSAAAAVHLLKGSLALAAVIALCGLFLPPLIYCFLYYLVFSAAGIAAEGCGQRSCGSICTLMAEGARLCASLLTLYFYIVFFSTILLLVTGNGG